MNYNNAVISQSVAEMKTEMPTDKYMMVLIGDNPDPTEGKARFYMFDYSSTATPDNNNYIVPNFPQFASVGRWVKIQTPTMQVNADWTSVSGLSQILNKPTLSTVATSGAYADLSGKPTLATVATSGAYNDLSGKPSLALVATSGSYNDLSNKPTIPSAYVYTVGSPNTLSIVAGTAYQATLNTKPAAIIITLTSSASLTLGGGSTISADLVIGPTNAVAGGTGFTVAKYLNSLTGTLVIGVAINNGQTITYTLPIPTGWWFAVRSTGGAGLTVVSAFDQSLG